MLKAKAEFTLTFDSEKKTNAVYNALKPETDAGPSDRTSVLLHQRKDTIGLNIEAMDSASLRASVNTYSRWINMTKSLTEV